jgi:hypothetical protein
MENKTITPVMIIGFCEHEGAQRACATPFPGHQAYQINEFGVAAALVSAYEAFLDYIPEDKQVQFEEVFKKIFDDLFEKRYDYMNVAKRDDAQQ